MIKIFILANEKLLQIDVENSDDTIEMSHGEIDVYEVETENTSRVVATDVVSFICYKNYIIYNKENKIFIYRDNKVISELEAEENSTLLMVNNNEIVMQSKSGSLESITVEEFGT
ncbi:hypothetical protein ENBRE01_3384 [Enteropsectra breve]|nr:hypothetical protein ENBRE01_3384 [Enteropsectra breve]